MKILALAVLVTIAVAASACSEAVTPAYPGDEQLETLDQQVTPTEQSTSSEMPTAYPAPRLTDAAAHEARRGTASATGIEAPLAATDMVQFDSPVLGLSFEYPSALGDLNLRVAPGETGQAFYGGFEQFDALMFEGRSHDFSEGRGGHIGDTLGFEVDSDGSYLALTIPAPQGSPIEVEDVLDVGGREILIVGSGFTGSDRGDLGEAQRAALLNLDGEVFPGLIMINLDEARLPYETFLAILETVEVREPTESP